MYGKLIALLEHCILCTFYFPAIKNSISLLWFKPRTFNLEKNQKARNLTIVPERLCNRVACFVLYECAWLMNTGKRVCSSLVGPCKLHAVLWVNVPENNKLYSSYNTEDYIPWPVPQCQFKENSSFVQIKFPSKTSIMPSPTSHPLIHNNVFPLLYFSTSVIPIFLFYIPIQKIRRRFGGN